MAVNGVMFTVLFPITFLANTFSPTEPHAALAAGHCRMESGVVTGGLRPPHRRLGPGRIQDRPTKGSLRITLYM
jgi:hypothetical protein